MDIRFFVSKLHGQRAGAVGRARLQRGWDTRMEPLSITLTPIMAHFAARLYAAQHSGACGRMEWNQEDFAVQDSALHALLEFATELPQRRMDS